MVEIGKRTGSQRKAELGVPLSWTLQLGVWLTLTIVNAWDPKVLPANRVDNCLGRFAAGEVGNIIQGGHAYLGLEF